jgi:HAMP domain-containing protein
VVLLVIYGLSFLAYRLSRQAISPIVQLAHRLEEFDFEHDTSIQVDLNPLREVADAEVLSMINAVETFSERLRLSSSVSGYSPATPVTSCARRWRCSRAHWTCWKAMVIGPPP